MEPKYKVVGRDDDRPTLTEMQEFVGGHIEIVYSNLGDFVINDEGLLDGLPINFEATDRLWEGMHGVHGRLPVLVGNVMLIEGGLD